MAYRFLAFGALLVLALFASAFFLWKGNDHLECSSKTETKTDTNGCVTVVETHVCQERFSI
ncbi:MAG: hypothetical protein ACO1OQ_05300 [Rufibacter sp.]